MLSLLGLAGRPAEIPGIGPVDPALARDLARAAAASPGTTWCVTVTDGRGHATGHGCARPEATSRRKRPGPAPPGGTRIRDGPGFAFTPSGQPGPPGGYGTWRLRAGASGPRDLLVALDPVSTGDCDHRFRPGVMIPGSGSGTWPRSGTLPAPARSAGGLLAIVISNITSRTRPAAGAACVMAALSAVTTTASSSTHGGRPISSPTPPSGGPPHPTASTPPNPPATPSERPTQAGRPGSRMR
jgi:hypothetical protein